VKLVPDFIRRRWRRILIWSGTGFVILGVYAYFFGVATMLALEARHFGRTEPLLWKTPIALPSQTASSSPALKLSYLGLEFEVPWTDLDETITRPIGAWQFIAFHSGKTITVAKFRPDEFVRGWMSLGKLDDKDKGGLDQVMGPGTMANDYSLFSAALQITPASITLWTPRREAVRDIELLVLAKSELVRDSETGLFAISTSDLRGFQCGDPRSRPHEVVEHLFADRSGIDLTFQSRKSDYITQEEINRIVGTLRVVNP
jgi:hypothetical protein